MEESTGHPPTDGDSIDMEKEWIYNKLVNGSMPLFRGFTNVQPDQIKDEIASLLELMHIQKLEV